ncbi:hypothetical protein BCR43DRAFT_509456 [Syncephalastrum racemosum]|uniref:NADH dehydrogenase [ubiquinone] 1 alpha subcomplex subunit n=1 Tax=Syncephalastrum racemosum TaxID=13706 RepID=A0A1X2HRV7_SYNRA|nr:hypothetical protein BCR43DRAFT_509456 [Syncephalastrum racemosum]
MSKATLARLKEVYKTTRFPWKKQALVGVDLNGNEYYDMPNPNHLGRWKRWVQMKEISDDHAVFQEDQLPVQWQAWLRHTRHEAPTIQELLREQQRRLRLAEKVRQLEAIEEQRKAKPSMQIPEKQAEQPSPEPKLEEKQEPLKQESPEQEPPKQEKPKKRAEEVPNAEPTGSGETFVPGAWTPTSPRRR